MKIGNNRFLIVIRRSPYGSSLAKASIDLALAAAAFDQPVDLLFMGDGVLQLCPGQDSSALGVKNIGKQLAAMSLYDIDRIYVDAEAAARFNVDVTACTVEVCSLNSDQLHQLFSSCDHLLSL